MEKFNQIRNPRNGVKFINEGFEDKFFLLSNENKEKLIANVAKTFESEKFLIQQRINLFKTRKELKNQKQTSTIKTKLIEVNYKLLQVNLKLSNLGTTILKLKNELSTHYSFEISKEQIQEMNRLLEYGKDAKESYKSWEEDQNDLFEEQLQLHFKEGMSDWQKSVIRENFTKIWNDNKKREKEEKKEILARIKEKRNLEFELKQQRKLAKV